MKLKSKFHFKCPKLRKLCCAGGFGKQAVFGETDFSWFLGNRRSLLKETSWRWSLLDRVDEQNLQWTVRLILYGVDGCFTAARHVLQPEQHAVFSAIDGESRRLSRGKASSSGGTSLPICSRGRKVNASLRRNSSLVSTSSCWVQADAQY